MMKKFIGPLFLTLVLSLASTVVHAESKSISKQQAIDAVNQSYPGRVLGVKRKSDTYQVKTLSESGKLRVIQVDAKSGAVVSGSGNNSARQSGNQSGRHPDK